MASWHYAFLFPDSQQRLAPAGAVQVFSEFGCEFDHAIRPAIVIDDDGHLENGDETALDQEPAADLRNRLNKNEQFTVECRNRDLFFSLSFATRYSNPYILIAWSRKIFERLERTSRDDYWQLLRNVANTCNAKYVVIVDDPPDFFEDKFIEIDGRRMLDPLASSGKPYDIRGVWASVDLEEQPPEGVQALESTDLGDGFIEYPVNQVVPV